MLFASILRHSRCCSRVGLNIRLPFSAASGPPTLSVCGRRAGSLRCSPRLAEPDGIPLAGAGVATVVEALQCEASTHHGRLAATSRHCRPLATLCTQACNLPIPGNGGSAIVKLAFPGLALAGSTLEERGIEHDRSGEAITACRTLTASTLQGYRYARGTRIAPLPIYWLRLW